MTNVDKNNLSRHVGTSIILNINSQINRNDPNTQVRIYEVQVSKAQEKKISIKNSHTKYMKFTNT